MTLRLQRVLLLLIVARLAVANDDDDHCLAQDELGCVVGKGEKNIMPEALAKWILESGEQPDAQR
jgi:hypothetical protein